MGHFTFLRLCRDYWIIKKSKLFDEEYYLKTYADVRKKDIDPLWHFVKLGWKGGRNPSADFDTKLYLETHPDVKTAGVNPLVYYIEREREEIKGGKESVDTNIFESIKLKSLKNNIFLDFLINRIFKKIPFLFIIRSFIKISNVFYKRVSFFKIYYYIKKYGIKIFLKKSINKLKTEIMRKCNVCRSNNKWEHLLYKRGEKLVIPYFKNPTVSIIIPVFNQFYYTMSCIKSIIHNTENLPYEIILVDDNSTDETKTIEKYVKNLKIIRNEKNQGFLLNCNRAANSAIGRYILILNNDTILLEGCINFMYDLMEKNPDIGLVGPKFLYPDGRLQEAGGIIWKDASGWNYGKGDDPEKSEYNYLKEVDYISGACILIRKELWDEIGGFDDRFAPAYFEDTDFAFEVRRKGYKVIYQPKSEIIHFEGISCGTDENDKNSIKSFQVKNKEKFIKKWEEVLAKEHFENGEDVFLARDRGRFKKHILVIDHYVPHFDQDAGSRTIFIVVENI